MNNLQTLISGMQADKKEFSGENLGPIVECIYIENGDKAITNAQVNELTAAGGDLSGILSASQLRGKAVSMGHYQKKTEAEKSSENGTSQTRKSEYVNALEIFASMPKGSLESLGKGKKPELEALVNALSARNDSQSADNA